jgi:hypothetical protein
LSEIQIEAVAWIRIQYHSLRGALAPIFWPGLMGSDTTGWFDEGAAENIPQKNALALVTIVYLISVYLVKRWFFAHYQLR